MSPSHTRRVSVRQYSYMIYRMCFYRYNNKSYHEILFFLDLNRIELRILRTVITIYFAVIHGYFDVNVEDNFLFSNINHLTAEIIYPATSGECARPINRPTAVKGLIIREVMFLKWVETILIRPTVATIFSNGTLKYLELSFDIRSL